MKIAIALVGHLRTFEEIKNSFKLAFANYSCDIFLHSYTKRYGYHPCNVRRLKFSDDDDISELTIKEAFKDLNLVSFKLYDPSFVSQDKIMQPEWSGYANLSSNCLNPIILFDRIIRDISLYSLDNSIEYDFVVKMRCDLILYRSLSFMISRPDEILINKWNVFPNDWILIGKLDSMKRLSKNLVNEIYSPSDNSSKSNPPHGFYMTAAKNANLFYSSKTFVKGILRVNNKIEWDWRYRITSRFYYIWNTLRNFINE